MTDPLCRHASSSVLDIAYETAGDSQGDAVLLSPACASFDMFRNYAHRGEVFAAIVKEARDAGRD